MNEVVVKCGDESNKIAMFSVIPFVIFSKKKSILTFSVGEHDNDQSFGPLIFRSRYFLLIFVLKMEEEKISRQKHDTSFNRRLSIAEKLKIIKYAENSIHASSNLYGVSRTIIRYWVEMKTVCFEVIKT